MASPTMARIIFSMQASTVRELKKQVPTRKRSQLIEELLNDYFTKKKQAQGWSAVEQLRQRYQKKSDPVKISSVEWLQQDRRNH